MKKSRIVIILLVISLITVSLYQTLATDITMNKTNVSGVDLSYTFNITDTTGRVVNVKSGATKVLDLFLTNPNNGTISYGIAYTPSSVKTDDITIAELSGSRDSVSGTINKNEKKQITIVIVNNSTSDITLTLVPIAGYEHGGDLIVPSNHILITEEYEIKEPVPEPNHPDLLEGLIPIMYKDNKWVKADETNEDNNYKWYDYNNQIWANAVLVSASSRAAYKSASMGTTINESDILAYYVWIPRYKYKLFNANKEVGVDSYNAQTNGIDILFESGTNTTGTVSCTIANNGTESCVNAKNGEYYTHPAFTFGSTELTGIWVGKFELTGSTTNPTIKPNLSPIRTTNISSLSNGLASVSQNGNSYGINSSEANSHLIKNIEWGAVAYFTHSKYGRCINGTCVEVGINNYTSYKTGCGAAPGSDLSSTCNAYTTTSGMLASTTGNVYGIYDMNGGVFEYVMANMVDSSGAFNSNSSGFSPNPESKYYDKYAYGTSSTDSARGHLGDATSEILLTSNNGWNSDFVSFPTSSSPWVARSGDLMNTNNAGIFYTTGTTGSISYYYYYYSGRAALVRN